MACCSFLWHRPGSHSPYFFANSGTEILPEKCWERTFIKELQITSWRVVNCKNKQTKNSKHKTGPFIYLTFNCASKMTWRWCIYRWKTIQDYIWISRIALMQSVTAVVTWLSFGWNRLSTNQKASVILCFPFPSYALVP